MTPNDIRLPKTKTNANGMSHAMQSYRVAGTTFNQRSAGCDDTAWITIQKPYQQHDAKTSY